MPTAQTAANSAAFLRTIYDGRDPSCSAREKDPLLAEVSEVKTWGGKSAQPIVVRYSLGSGVSPSFSVAQATAKHSKGAAFAVPSRKLYAIGYVDGAFIEETAADNASYVRALSDKTKVLREDYNDSWANLMWSQAGGRVGTIPTGATLTGATLTFATVSEANFFEIDREYEFASDDGTAVSPAGLRDSGRRLTVTGISLETKTVTFSGNLNTVSGIAVGDSIFPAGTYSEAMDGILSWLPITAPTGADSFRGVNRSVAPNKLAGYRFSGGSASKSTAIREALAEAASAGCRPKRLYCNPIDAQEVITDMQGYATIPLSGDTLKVGWTGVEIRGAGRSVTLVAADKCPQGYAIGLDPSEWRWWVGKSGMGHIQNFDDLKQLRVYNADALEIRMAGYGPGMCPKAESNALTNGLVITF